MRTLGSISRCAGLPPAPPQMPAGRRSVSSLLAQLLLLALSLPASAQTPDTSYLGKDFWVAFMPNASDGVPDNYNLCFAAKRTCSVTITAPAATFSYTLSATPGSLITYPVPVAAAYQSGSCIVAHTGLHVTATDSIWLYAQNRDGSPNSADATAVLPSHALGSSYLLQTYPANRPNTAAAACFSVVATLDNTRLSISLTGPTSTGLPAGATIDTTLHAGEVFQVKSPSGTGDFSGTSVCSPPGKPVALFAGNSVIYIPSNGLGGDHVYMQMPPVECLGTTWVLTPTYTHGQPASDHVRITAPYDATAFTLNGSPLVTLSARQSHEIVLTNAGVLSASAPALVCQYIDSRHNSGQNQDYGDPAGFVVTPVEQAARQVQFGTMYVDSRSPAVTHYYVNIALPTADTSLLTLDSQPLSGYTPIAPTGTYSHARCTLSNGRHTIATTGSGFTAHHYGIGENWDSYDIPVGGQAKKLAAPTSAQWDTIDTVVCGTSFLFRGDTLTRSGLYPFGTSCGGGILLRLTLTGSRRRSIHTTACDSILFRGHTYRLPGSYSDTIPMPDGCDSVVTLQLSHVYHSASFHIDTATCDSILPLGDTLIASPGHHEFHRRTVHGCDSLVTIDLDLFPHYDIGIDTSICHHHPFLWHDTTIRLTGDFSRYCFVYRTVHGCDSLITLNLHYSGYDTTWYVTIMDTTTYTWVNGQEYNRSIDTTITLQSVVGCDSTLRLVLRVEPSPADPILWVPNVFTPGQETNNRFAVTAIDMQEVVVSIYNRWGDFVCRFDGLTESWDGTKDGKPCKPDAYVYLIRCVTTDGIKLPERAGTVTLLR